MMAATEKTVNPTPLATAVPMPSINTSQMMKPRTNVIFSISNSVLLVPTKCSKPGAQP